MLYKTFDWLMTKLGHKYALTDIFGNVSVYRYYIFFVEKNAPVTWKEKYLPNLMVHNFLGEETTEKKEVGDNPIGETSHIHPWSTLTFILKGGYSEELNYNQERDNKRFSFAYRNWSDSHRFIDIRPNTWTLFFHGIRRGMWAFDLRVHDTICTYCQTNNDNVCANTGKGKSLNFPEAREIHLTSKESKGWRETRWIKCDQDFDALITERKAAIARGKITKQYHFGYNDMVKFYAGQK